MARKQPSDPSSNRTDPWLTRDEAADYAKVSTATLRRAYQNGDLQSARIPNGRVLRFRRSWIDIWLLNGNGIYAVVMLFALLLACWVMLCASGLNDPCHFHQLLEHAMRRV